MVDREDKDSIQQEPILPKASSESPINEIPEGKSKWEVEDNIPSEAPEAETPKPFLEDPEEKPVEPPKTEKGTIQPNQERPVEQVASGSFLGDTEIVPGPFLEDTEEATANPRTPGAAAPRTSEKAITPNPAEVTIPGPFLEDTEADTEEAAANPRTPGAAAPRTPEKAITPNPAEVTIPGPFLEDTEADTEEATAAPQAPETPTSKPEAAPQGPQEETAPGAQERTFRPSTLSYLRGGGMLFQTETERGPEAYVFRRSASGRMRMIKVPLKNVGKLTPRIAGVEQVLASRDRMGWDIHRMPQEREQGGGQNILEQLRGIIQPVLPLLERIAQALQQQEKQVEQEQRPKEGEQAANIRLGAHGDAQTQLAQQGGPVTVRLQPGTRFRIDANTDTIEVVS